MSSFNITFIDNQQVVDGVPRRTPNYQAEVMSGLSNRTRLFYLNVDNTPQVVNEFSSANYGQRGSVLIRVKNLAATPLDITGVTSEGVDVTWVYYNVEDYWYATITPASYASDWDGKDVVVKVAPYDVGEEPEPEPEPDPMDSVTVSQYLIDKWEADNFYLKVDGVRVWLGDTYIGNVFEFETVDGYVFDYIGTYDIIWEAWDYLELTEGGRVATISDTSIDLDDLQYSLDVVEEPEPEDPEPELPTISVDQYLIDDWNEDNFHLEVDGVPVVTGGDYSGEEFTFVADGNYVFVSVGFYDVITEQTTNLVLSSNRKIAYLPVEMVEDIYWSGFRYDLEFSEEVQTDVRGANSVFRVSDEALKEITHKRFDQPTSGNNVDDFGKFILGLIELPFKVGEEFVLGTEPVRLGRLNTGVMGEVLSVDRMSFDLGSISVGEEFGDFRDYQDVVGVLHLPYAESVVLETEYVVGQEISIELAVSLYDGSADYVIRSSFADGVALTQKVHLEVDVPFANVDGVPQRNSPSNMTFGVHNGVYTAYVELKRRETLLVDGMFTIPVVDEALLGDQSGFVRVDEVELSVECTAQEMDMLESVLREGVFIK